MKVSGRALELNAIFLVAVLLLVSLQVFLHHVQKRMYTEEVRNLSERAVPVPSAEELDGELAGAALGVLDEAAPSQPAFVPNIRKSFPKRKAHYFRKLKKSKKNKKNKAKKAKKASAAGGEGKQGGGKGQGKADPSGPKKDAPHARGKAKAMGAKKEAKLMHDDIVRLKKAVQREMSEGRKAEKANPPSQ
ncbi:uncharacterized protein LOC125039863 isoform X1 [Penaeus chinensis]|uniref:uncharacterized protein LOC125039863 isoform X1 n=1 Tax=Penaeus chinensis TaxID=139456 RepID=UPI001FB696BE|nr:uncharacterized protein LOC125039863 isoform X1 [Penaeus chinensis]XP_047490130.1 uncharacterized protein LOC125039863 isoform X1 [Penaeus chinensis]XP_047490132.1 uncharacterized protein LOC125039863 isoform X1 [Penaeus chinensis]XP_047490133.1 uncharacterized protein LOC125039863 isoform X1 [Penaeus chinensis]XP_047490134.1 uncharacterized protein LOC125039863 isoform X1 [Penaeus chinensis]XP_047490135.1 uncharacterized protein LOC125039863 isoform X1 [Penaeus chinensis]XP_047490136.1 un